MALLGIGVNSSGSVPKPVVAAPTPKPSTSTTQIAGNVNAGSIGSNGQLTPTATTPSGSANNPTALTVGLVNGSLQPTSTPIGIAGNGFGSPSTLSGVTKPPTTAPSPQVVASAAPAVASLNTTKTAANNINAAVTSQAQSNAAAQAAAQQAAAAQAAAQQQVEQQNAADAAQTDALNNAAAAASGTPYLPGTSGQVTTVPGTNTAGATSLPGSTPTNGSVQTDANGNPIPTDASGNPEVTPGEQQTGVTYASIAQQTQDAVNSFNTSMNQLANGTFPLTPTEQASINSTNQVYQNMISQQQQANAAATANVTNYNIRTGLSEFAPLVAQADIQNAVNTGLQQIQTIEANASKALSDLNTAIYNSNYTAVNDSYNNLTKALAQKTTALDDLNTQISTIAKDQATAQTAAQTAARESLGTLMTQLGGTAFENLTPDQQTAMNQLEQQAGWPAGLVQAGMDTVAQQKIIASQQEAADKLAATQQQDAITNSFKEMALAISAQKAGSSLTQDDVTNLVGTLNDYNGQKYVTPTDLTGYSSTDKNTLITALKQAGIPTLTPKDSDAINSIQTAQGDLQDFQTMIQGLKINPQGPVSRLFYGAGTATLQQWLQANGQAGAYNTWALTAIPLLSGLKGAGTTGAGGAARLFNTVANLLPSATDTLATVNSKVTALNQLLDQGAKSLLGGANSEFNGGSPVAGTIISYDGQNYSVDSTGNMTLVNQ